MHAIQILTALFAVALPQQKPAWPHTQSDVSADPRIHFGVLDNGVRWAWMDNPEPKERCYLRLFVDAGSLCETDSERGMAHFLEHMCFNGTKHHPGTSLIEWFQSHGMSFGGDTNAHTGFGETVYEINLPTCDEKALTEALEVLRDDCDGLLLEAKDVEEEKGVIDAEERAHDSAETRAQLESMKLEYAGTRVPERFPIGDKAARDAFTAEAVRAFQSKWYRPERLAVIVVGDLRAKSPLPLIDKSFASLAKPSSEPAAEPPLGTPKRARNAYVVEDGELGSTTISVRMARPWKQRPETKAQWAAEVPLAAAHAMLNLRFTELRKQAGAPFLAAYAVDAHDSLESAGLPVEDAETLVVTTRAETWREALTACEQELRRAIEHGFAKSELDELRADLLRQLDEAVQREPTRSSASWIAAILQSASSHDVPVNASTRREIARPVLETLDSAACQKALAAAWKDGTLILGMQGPLALGADGVGELEKAWQKSREARVEPRVTAELAPFAYASDPSKAGAIVARDRIEDLDVHRVTFENGVRLFVKRTDFQKKQVLVSVAFGRGKLDIDPARYPVAWVAQFMFDACGLEAHSADDLRKLFAGKRASASFAIYPDRFELSGATTREDLLRECELLRARLEHAGWRAEGPRILAQRIPVMYETLEHKSGGPLSLRFLPEIHPNDPSKGVPARAAIEAVSLDEVKAWLDPIAKTSSFDVAIVGDVDVEDAVQAAARTFGVSKRRESGARTPPKDAKIVTGLHRRYEIDTKDETATVLVVYPTTDGRDVGVARRLDFLADVLADRLRVEIRERLGEAYSPSARSLSSRSTPGDGILTVQVDAGPSHADAVVDAVLAVGAKLAESGPTQDEVDRAREPAEAALRDAKRKNAYWLEALTELHSRDTSLDELRTDAAWLASVKPEELAPLAKQYLTRERADVAVVVPRAKAGSSEASSAESSAPKSKD